MTRKEFEIFLAARPYEKDVSRYPDYREYSGPWPGQYKDIAVQLAWEVLVETKRRKQEREQRWVLHARQISPSD